MRLATRRENPWYEVEADGLFLLFKLSLAWNFSPTVSLSLEMSNGQNNISSQFIHQLDLIPSASIFGLLIIIIFFSPILFLVYLTESCHCPTTTLVGLLFGLI